MDRSSFNYSDIFMDPSIDLLHPFGNNKYPRVDGGPDHSMPVVPQPLAAADPVNIEPLTDPELITLEEALEEDSQLTLPAGSGIDPDDYLKYNGKWSKNVQDEAARRCEAAKRKCEDSGNNAGSYQRAGIAKANILLFRGCIGGNLQRKNEWRTSQVSEYLLKKTQASQAQWARSYSPVILYRASESSYRIKILHAVLEAPVMLKHQFCALESTDSKHSHLPNLGHHNSF
ncbi:hypothetical protein B0H10DRAFT_1938249 [Mycena sp. CBHHK59/15]|nr:hypothetical protein B0H10DRAFT_1938249 [Mycena sp. CBHHK59/15]